MRSARQSRGQHRPLRVGAALCAALLLLGACSGTLYTMDDAPQLDSGDEIQIYYLEAPFPYNAPQDIKNAAGSSYNSYATNHAGLGIWDTTSGEKFTIEFVSVDYVGGLLPETSDGQISWHNAGSVVITDPVDDANWVSSRLITTTIGSAYSQLITFLQDNRALFEAYQPITGLFVNATSFNPDTITNNGQVYEQGTTVVASTGSYWFVDLLVDELSKYGCDLEAFLSVYSTTNNYLSATQSTAAAVPVVEWTTSAVNQDVYYWYGNLSACYSDVYNQTVETGLGAQFFLTAVKDCYGDYAYIFRSNVSAYKLALHNYTDSYTTPLVASSVYELPGDNSGDAEKLGALDYIMIAVAFCAVVGGATYFLFKLLGKKKRRHISFEGERIAENIVGPLADSNHEDRAYYHGRGTKTFLERMNPFSTSKATHMKRETVRFESGNSDNSLERPLTLNEC